MLFDKSQTPTILILTSTQKKNDRFKYWGNTSHLALHQHYNNKNIHHAAQVF